MNKDIQYQGARFYKCALQVNPHNYAQKYQGGAPQNEDVYNDKILRYCKENEIEVVGLADHGSVVNSEKLRGFLEDKHITVFPGFEIASSEKIHMVCLYSEETNTATLNQNLGQVMGDSTLDKYTTPSSLSCQTIAKLVLKEQEGFWYAGTRHQ